MLCQPASMKGPFYATSFEEIVLGSKCKVEVIVDLSTKDYSVVTSMGRTLTAEPAFRIGLAELKQLLLSITQMKKSIKLLDELAPDAKGHQLNCTCGGATMVMTKQEKKDPRYSLTIGLFHKEGALKDFDYKELDEAIGKLEALANQVLKRIAGPTS